jgi:hypothetical protein
VAEWLETAAIWTLLATLVILLSIPHSPTSHSESGKQSSTVARGVSRLLLAPGISATTATLAAISYVVLVFFDVARIHAPAQHGMSLLLIASLCSGDDMSAARIAVAGTWFWGGLNKINPNFLENFSTVADPFLSNLLGAEFVNQHRVPLHLVAALTEATAGLALLVVSAKARSEAPRSRWLVWMVRLSVVFLLSMHLMIIYMLIRLQWEYSVLGWNVHCLYLAVQLWRPWWRRQPSRSMETLPDGKDVRDGCTATILSLAVFVLLPAFLPCGLIDPYLGISLYTDNVPDLEIELPADGKELYQQWGFLDDIGSWNSPLLPAATHDGRRVYVRHYMLLHVAATDGHVAYPSQWAHRSIVSSLCERLQDAAPPHLPETADEARFYLHRPYLGWSLFSSLWTMASSAWLPQKDGESPAPPPTLVRKGCQGDEWQSTVMSSPLRTLEISIRGFDPPAVGVYSVGAVGPAEGDGVPPQPELVFLGQATVQTPLRIFEHVGSYLLAALGSPESRDFCALEVWVIIPSEDELQMFVLDFDIRNSKERRTVPRVKFCPIDGEYVEADTGDDVPRSEVTDEDDDALDIERPTHVVTFVNGHTSASIDIFWVPPDGHPPELIESDIPPGSVRVHDTYEGSRFRAVSSSDDGVVHCPFNRELVVPADQEDLRYEFCIEYDGENDQANDEF